MEHKGGPTLKTFTDEEILDELAIRLAARVKKEEETLKPASLTWRALRVRETLLESMVTRTLEEMDAPAYADRKA